ncbi:MAG: helix-turn-helix domain-containing protein [Muribaculaceae bacterium]|nr:helix-turn-helix domain-containing protein [Muribaculaceae bacterium]
MEGTIANRLKGYIESIGLSVSQFADACGIPRPSLSQLLTGRNKKVSNTLVEQIHNAFPDLSILWLMFGEGPVSSVPSMADGDFEAHISGTEAVNPDRGSGDSKYSKENGLNTGYNGSELSDSKLLEANLKIRDLQEQIAVLRKNPRKVTQITIYYEDSTFETFVPSGK